MAELADVQDLGSCAARRVGSTPTTRTKNPECECVRDFYFFLLHYSFFLISTLFSGFLEGRSKRESGIGKERSANALQIAGLEALRWASIWFWAEIWRHWHLYCCDIPAHRALILLLQFSRNCWNLSTTKIYCFVEIEIEAEGSAEWNYGIL